jgi:ribosomal-protein-alanine N-acetyltransferase
VNAATVKRPQVAAAANAVPAPLDWQPMQAADLDAVMAVEKRIYPFPWTLGNFRDSLAAGHGAYVFCEAGIMVGYAVMTTIVDETHLLTIGVVAERQRLGLGGRMLERLFAVARQQGAQRMLLEVRPSNAAALALYRRHGFDEIGRRRGYYPAGNAREDAIVMARAL